MPTKHIDNDTWRLIERINVKAVLLVQRPIKEAKIIRFLLRRGLKNITENELKEL